MVDLTGQLSNLSQSLQALFSLPLPPPGRVVSRAGKPIVKKRRLGDVRDAMIAVLAQENGYLRVAEIYERVGKQLDGPVAHQYIRDFLNNRSRGEKPLFERGDWGHYRLHQALDVNQLWPTVGEARTEPSASLLTET